MGFHAQRKKITRGSWLAGRAGFDLQVQDDPYQPTDVASFNQVGVPSLNFFTGTHTDYHRPSDTADKLNSDGMREVAQLAFRTALDLAESDTLSSFRGRSHQENAATQTEMIESVSANANTPRTGVRGLCGKCDCMASA